MGCGVGWVVEGIGGRMGVEELGGGVGCGRELGGMGCCGVGGFFCECGGVCGGVGVG